MTTYSISLDDVDLALLPARAGGYNDFLRREHYEFQVFAREDEDSTQTSHPCHICDIDVPAAFWIAHCASAKHRANVRIASAAAQRTRALITATPPPQLKPTGKFCDSCTIIAEKDHEKTKEHRISVIHDRMLCDLVKVYTGEDFDVKEIGNDDLENDRKKHVNKEDIKLDQNNTAKVLEDNTMKAESPKQNAVQGIDSNNFNHETYIKLLNIPSFPKIQIQLSGNGILILINNEKINVLPDNFHSYHRLGSKIQCRACCCTIDATEEKTHKLSMIHMKRIMQVVEDSHCIRKIYTNWSHCILCNLVINNKMVNSHKLSMSHCDKKAICTVPQGQTTKDVKKVSVPTSTASNSKENQPNQGVPNEVQNRGAEAKNAGVETKNAGNEAKNTGVEAKNTGATAKSIAVQNNNTGGPSNFQNAPTQNGQVNKSNNMVVYKFKEESKIEYPYKATEFPSSVYCVLCKCHVPNTPSNRSGHLKGARHAFSMKNVK